MVVFGEVIKFKIIKTEPKLSKSTPSDLLVVQSTELVISTKSSGSKADESPRGESLREDLTSQVGKLDEEFSKFCISEPESQAKPVSFVGFDEQR